MAREAVLPGPAPLLPRERIVLVCGGRDRHMVHLDAWWMREHVERVGATAIMHGRCNHRCSLHGCPRESVDRWAGLVAGRLGLREIAVPALWHRFGNEAGTIRNIQMLDHGPVLVLALPGARGLQLANGRPTGTGHTVFHARARGIETLVREMAA